MLTFFICLSAAVAWFQLWYCWRDIKLTQQFQAWSKRDLELRKRYWDALKAGDDESADQALYQALKNVEALLETRK